MSQHSEACCTIPPVVTKGYQFKGDYITVDGLTTYAVGPVTTKSAILMIYDIFGHYPQTLQGADILALSDKAHPYQVFIPDFFDGPACDHAWYPPKEDWQKQKLGEFFKGPAVPDKTVGRIPTVVRKLGEQYPNIENWGIVGFCWGGKVVSLATGTDAKLFKAAAACHPAFVDPNDANNIAVPICVLPSKDEDPKAVEQFEKNLKVEHRIETFHDQDHGWMGARGNLEDERVKSEYERGYKILLDFFHEYI
ncbi:MAG: hypothetical protein M1816_008056 [Peltula sp. TS41687]|nr:MAG: hypothetical protein M1816_008056 [Peltula sp. TS41687]